MKFYLIIRISYYLFSERLIILVLVIFSAGGIGGAEKAYATQRTNQIN